jgi:hypothetical protein
MASIGFCKSLNINVVTESGFGLTDTRRPKKQKAAFWTLTAFIESELCGLHRAGDPLARDRLTGDAIFKKIS